MVVEFRCRHRCARYQVKKDTHPGSPERDPLILTLLDVYGGRIRGAVGLIGGRVGNAARR